MYLHVEYLIKSKYKMEEFSIQQCEDLKIIIDIYKKKAFDKITLSDFKNY